MRAIVECAINCSQSRVREYFGIPKPKPMQPEDSGASVPQAAQESTRQETVLRERVKQVDLERDIREKVEREIREKVSREVEERVRREMNKRKGKTKE